MNVMKPAEVRLCTLYYEWLQKPEQKAIIREEHMAMSADELLAEYDGNWSSEQHLFLLDFGDAWDLYENLGTELRSLSERIEK